VKLLVGSSDGAIEGVALTDGASVVGCPRQTANPIKKNAKINCLWIPIYIHVSKQKTKSCALFYPAIVMVVGEHLKRCSPTVYWSLQQLEFSMG
jgi:hypothetical protein